MKKITIMLETPRKPYLFIEVIAASRAASAVNEACPRHIPDLSAQTPCLHAEIDILEIAALISFVEAADTCPEAMRQGYRGACHPGNLLLLIHDMPVSTIAKITVKGLLGNVEQAARALNAGNAAGVRRKDQLWTDDGVWVPRHRVQHRLQPSLLRHRIRVQEQEPRAVRVDVLAEEAGRLAEVGKKELPQEIFTLGIQEVMLRRLAGGRLAELVGDRRLGGVSLHL